MILVNILLSASVIGIAVWLTEHRADIAGFIVSLPLSTMLVLVLTQHQYGDGAKAVLLAKSITAALPVTLLFFVPFVLAEKLKLSFWLAYSSGIGLLVVGFFVHKYLFQFFLK